MPWPIRRCVGDLLNLAKSCRRTYNKRPKRSEHCKRQKSRSGGRLSKKRTSRRNESSGLRPIFHNVPLPEGQTYVRFSNRLFWVKRFQTIHHCSVDVARGLVLLFGLGTKAFPSWDSRTRWNDLLVGLAVGLTVGPSGHTNSPHPSSREGHHSTTVELDVLLLG